MIRANDNQPERLTDSHLLTRLMEFAAEARRRPALQATMRRFHAEELAEMQQEMLCRGSADDLTAEQILAITHVEADRPSFRMDESQLSPEIRAIHARIEASVSRMAHSAADTFEGA